MDKENIEGSRDSKPSVQIRDSKNATQEIVRKLVDSSKSNINYNVIADALNIRLSSLRNKLSRSAFSFIDFSIICYMVDAKFSIQMDDFEIQLTPETFLSKEDMQHLIEVKNRTNETILMKIRELAELLNGNSINILIDELKSSQKGE